MGIFKERIVPWASLARKKKKDNSCSFKYSQTGKVGSWEDGWMKRASWTFLANVCHCVFETWGHSKKPACWYSSNWWSCQGSGKMGHCLKKKRRRKEEERRNKRDFFDLNFTALIRAPPPCPEDQKHCFLLLSAIEGPSFGVLVISVTYNCCS